MWEKLQIFDVQYRESGSYGINDVLPVEFSNWRDLRIFNVNYNRINGTLPIQYSTWVNI